MIHGSIEVGAVAFNKAAYCPLSANNYVRGAFAFALT